MVAAGVAQSVEVDARPRRERLADCFAHLPRLEYAGSDGYTSRPVYDIADAVLRTEQRRDDDHAYIPGRRAVTLYVVGRSQSGLHLLADIVATCGKPPVVPTPFAIPITALAAYLPLQGERLQLARQHAPQDRDTLLERRDLRSPFPVLPFRRRNRNG